jgi:dTMP kinase
MERKGCFISFEGPVGAGKSTQIPKVADYFRQTGYELVVTREPGGTQVGDLIRTLVQGTEGLDIKYATEFLLYAASRAQHAEEIIIPALESGKLVLCDRYADSSVAYQGHGRGLCVDDLKAINNFATKGVYPDISVLLDLDIEVGLTRKSSKDGDWDRLDAENVDFHKKIRLGYLKLVLEDPKRWVVVDAERTPDEVYEELLGGLVWKMEALGLLGLR